MGGSLLLWTSNTLLHQQALRCIPPGRVFERIMTLPRSIREYSKCGTLQVRLKSSLLDTRSLAAFLRGNS